MSERYKNKGIKPITEADIKPITKKRKIIDIDMILIKGFDEKKYKRNILFNLIGVAVSLILILSYLKVENLLGGFSVFTVMAIVALSIPGFCGISSVNKARKYIPILKSKSVWNSEELIEMTKASRSVTEDLIKSMLGFGLEISESCYKCAMVDENNKFIELASKYDDEVRKEKLMAEINKML